MAITAKYFLKNFGVNVSIKIISHIILTNTNMIEIDDIALH